MDRSEQMTCEEKGLGCENGGRATHIVHGATVLQMLLDEATLGGIESCVHGVGLWNLCRLGWIVPNGVQKHELLHL